ncbi:microfibril-associated glycoprotein 4-like [Drosophila sulfurigaster albostrigata]|uniref:microfibril-associated glycoprotein 4-like n=1 Tax=Drosophila sulfurigaster albostrigata TaxID=89887 RepID=UPI002D219089|nr:microfibril-associated glycoprotein 4-like [Drosophila sulfurigaster albostrigata]
MVLKIITIIFVLNLFSSIAKSVQNTQFNETKEIIELNEKFEILRLENASLWNRIDELTKKLHQSDDGTLYARCAEATTDQKTEINKINGFIELKAKFKIGDYKIVIDEHEKERKVLDGGRLYPRNCAEATAAFKHSGIFELKIPTYGKLPFKVACDVETRGGNWTIILRRMDGTVNFTRNWIEYKKGFGDVSGEFFLGLDNIHAMTTDQRQELMVIVEDFKGDVRYELYSEFAIGSELDAYNLHTLGEATGTAGDSLRQHHNHKFSTFDRDNDDDSRNCAQLFTGAWWHVGCHHSQLTGTYNNTRGGMGVNWIHFRGHVYSLKRALMMIRPKE